jgi:hypothetical protein
MVIGKYDDQTPKRGADLMPEPLLGGGRANYCKTPDVYAINEKTFNADSCGAINYWGSSIIVVR